MKEKEPKTLPYEGTEPDRTPGGAGSINNMQSLLVGRKPLKSYMGGYPYKIVRG
jgi:hypothetical protein